MTKIKRNEQLNNLGDQAKSLVERGNARHVIIRNEDGSKVAEFSVTVAIIGAVLLFFMPWSWFIILGAAVYGIVKKLRVEVVRDLSNDDDAIQVDLDE